MRLRLMPSIPGYRTLDRYILGKFLRTYIFGLMMIIIIVVVFDYVEKVDDFTELKAPWSAVVNDYYLNFIPYFINQFSSLFTFIEAGYADRDCGYIVGWCELPTTYVAIFPRLVDYHAGQYGPQPMGDTSGATRYHTV